MTDFKPFWWRKTPAFQKLKILFAQQHKGEVLRYREMGGCIQTFLPSGERHYGDEVVTKIASDLGSTGTKAPSITLLWDWRNFFNSYPRKSDVEQLLRLAAKHGYQLSWSHFKYLLSIKDPAVRKNLAIACIRAGMSSSDLQHAVHAKNAEINKAKSRDKGKTQSDGKSSAGAKPRPPKSRSEGLRRLVSESRRWLRRCEPKWFTEESAAIRKLLADVHAGLEALKPGAEKALKKLEQPVEADSAKPPPPAKPAVKSAKSPKAKRRKPR